MLSEEERDALWAEYIRAGLAFDAAIRAYGESLRESADARMVRVFEVDAARERKERARAALVRAELLDGENVIYTESEDE